MSADVRVAEEIHLGKRTHRKIGFYSSLLQCKTKRKATRSCREGKNVSAASSLTATVTDVSKDEPLQPRSQRNTTFVPSTKLKQKAKDAVLPGKELSGRFPPTVATTRKNAADNEETVNLQAEQGSSVHKVVAIVTADANTQSKAIQWVQEQEPLQPDLVSLDVTAGQLTVKGSLKQVHQILSTLAQLNGIASEEEKPCGQLSGTKNLNLTNGTPFASDKNGVPVSSDAGVACPLSRELCDVGSTVEVSSTDFDAAKEIISMAQGPVRPMDIAVESSNFSHVRAEKVNTLEPLLSQQTSGTANRNASRLVKPFSTSETERALSIPSGIILDRNTDASSNLGSSMLTTTMAKKRSSQSTLDISEPSNKRRLAVKSLLTQAVKDRATMSTDSSDVDSSVEAPSLQLVVSGNFRCKICGNLYADDYALRGHMLSHHGNKDEMPSYLCEICTLVFPDKHTFHSHLKDQHEGPDRSCLICRKRFQCRRYLRTHIQRHAGVKKCECPICGWSFFERHKLKYHMEGHKKESERNLPYQCAACGKKFVNRAAWSDHCNTHSGQRPFRCDICSASFSHRVGLGRHKLVHEKVKPHECNICHRTFAVKPKLLEHLTTHTGVSKHTCPHCHKVFTAAFSLKRHLTKCDDTGWNKGDHASINSAQALSQSPVQDIVVVTGDNSAEQALGISEADASMQPQIDSEQIFVCGTCSLSYSTLQEAEQHVVTHVLEAETLQVLEVPLPTTCDGSGSESEIQLTKLADARQCIAAYKNVQNTDST